MSGGAVISDDGRYRYLLWRRWDELTCARPPMGFVMLNPSTAGVNVDDPTVRRCISFAKREGCCGINIVNLYGFRATEPAELNVAAGAGINLVGLDNDIQIADLMAVARRDSTPVVAAWGAKGPPHRVQYVKTQALAFGVQLQCLGTTKDGHPRHPLYVKGDQPLVPFPTEAAL